MQDNISDGFPVEKEKPQHLNKFTFCFRKERLVLNCICSQEGYILSGSESAFIRKTHTQLNYIGLQDLVQLYTGPTVGEILN